MSLQQVEASMAAFGNKRMDCGSAARKRRGCRRSFEGNKGVAVGMEDCGQVRVKAKKDASSKEGTRQQS